MDWTHLLPQAVDVGLQRVRGHLGIVAPDLIQQDLPSDRPRPRAVQELEDCRLLVGQADTAVLSRILQQLGGGTEGPWPDGEDRVLAVFEDADLGAQPRQQPLSRNGLETKSFAPELRLRTTSASAADPVSMMMGIL